MEVESWKETRGELRVAANVLVERDSQKAIVVGRGGQMLKKIGVESRKKIAELCGLPVHLNLWVKTDKNWSKRPRRARQLGLPVVGAEWHLPVGCARCLEDGSGIYT